MYVVILFPKNTREITSGVLCFILYYLWIHQRLALTMIDAHGLSITTSQALSLMALIILFCFLLRAWPWSKPVHARTHLNCDRQVQST